MTPVVQKPKGFASLADEMLSVPGVHLGHGKKGFGENALTVDGKIFAMLTKGNEFVVKLPRERVSELASKGEGSHFMMAGRQMNEWLSVGEQTRLDWLDLAREALGFVASKA